MQRDIQTSTQHTHMYIERRVSERREGERE